MDDVIPDEEKSRRLALLQEKQREIQRRRNLNQVGQTHEVMVEGRNEARGQWLGRTSQNKIPVSYTHLDVYKRQERFHAERCGWLSR